MAGSIETNGTPSLADECKKWEKQCAELARERDELRAELAQVKTERDSYLKTVHWYLRKELPPPEFTREELVAHRDDKPNILDVIAEMESNLEKPA